MGKGGGKSLEKRSDPGDVGGGRDQVIQTFKKTQQELGLQGFPGGSVLKNPPANAADMGSIPDLGRSYMQQILHVIRHPSTKPMHRNY